MASGSGDFLFDQELLEKTSGQVKEDSIISSNVSLLRLACSGFKDKCSAFDASSPSRVESSRFGSSFGKRSGSLARDSSVKCLRGGRGKTASSSRKGFQKYESCPCPISVGGCLSLHWQVWSDSGADPWVVVVLKWAYCVRFLLDLPLAAEPIPFPSYSPTSIRGKALEKEVQSLVEKGAGELSPLPSLGFYSRIFVVMKALGPWRPVIDLSTLNLRVRKTPFKMETLHSVLSVRSGDRMLSIDLRDAYLQVPERPDSCKYLIFVALNQVFQFKALFCPSTALQVFTRVMAPVSAFLHHLGIRMCRYLDDWLIQASSRPLVLQAMETVAHLCRDLSIVINWEKSSLLPSQRVVYLGVILDATLFRASPSQPRVEKLCLFVEEFLSCDVQPVSLWRKLLGVLLSLTSIVPGGRLRMRALQLCLHHLWDQEDDATLIPWD